MYVWVVGPLPADAAADHNGFVGARTTMSYNP